MNMRLMLICCVFFFSAAFCVAQDVQPLILDLGSGVTIELVLIPAGEFTMGSPPSEKDRHGFGAMELQHLRKIPQGFYMGKFEITQKQWGAVMGQNPAYRKGDDLPVTRVSWEQAILFCDKLSEKLKRKVRLPWEAEWEYACRAGTKTAFSCGEDENSLLEYAWFSKNKEKDNVHPVGRKRPNAWGLYDMHGNALEWCLDQFEPYSLKTGEPYTPHRTGVEGPIEKDINIRVCRGGRYNDYAGMCRSAYRGHKDFNSFDDDLGLRIVVEAEAPAAAVAPQPPPGGPAGEKPLMIDLGEGVTMELMAIPAGEYLMGIPDAKDVFESQHHRRISKPFYIGRYEVTQRQWKAIMGSNPSKRAGQDLPVTNISWDDAQAFCAKLSALCRHRFRLPWEAEWEYACRAGTRSAYSFGDSPDDLRAYGWFSDNGGGLTHPVGKLKPNPWGLFDMHGNAEEWCQDWYGGYPKGDAADEKGPANDNGTGMRITRSAEGGSSNGARSASRTGRATSTSIDTLGLRVACELPYAGNRLAAESPAARPTPSSSRISGPTNKPPLVIDLGGGGGIELVELPAGTFVMGEKFERIGERFSRQDERKHQRRIAKPFYMGRYEITQRQWTAVVGKNPSKHQGDDLPVENVTGEDVDNFCKTLSERCGYTVRLPWEAEWEYACRAGTSSRYHFGDHPGDFKDYGWSSVNAKGETHPVGLLKPNSWGLYDMHGNVHEWVIDWYADYPAGDLLEVTGPTTDPGSMDRVWRGGSFNAEPYLGRSAARGHSAPKWGNREVGFRIVADPSATHASASAAVHGSDLKTAIPVDADSTSDRPADPESAARALAGAYRVTQRRSDGVERRGTAVLEARHTVLGLTLEYDDRSRFDGVGVRGNNGSEVWIVYGTPKTIGLAVYQIKGGVLDGVWYPWYAVDGNEKNLGAETLSGPPGLAGEFAITAAKAPATGAAYGGTVVITPTDVVLEGDVNTYSLKWTIGEVTYIGVGICVGNWLLVGAGSGTDVGVARLSFDNDTLTGAGFNNNGTKDSYVLQKQANK